MSKELSANIHDPNHTVDEYDIYFNGDIISGSGDHELSANIHDPNHTAEEYDIYFNGELIESGGGGGSSDMHGWTDGIPYTDLEIVHNEYVEKTDGSFVSYDGWSRTGYVPCDGCSKLLFKLNTHESIYNAFYDSNKNFINTFRLNFESNISINVPSTAHYFALSNDSQRLNECISRGIVPNA